MFTEPNIKLISLIRDPRDILCSIINHLETYNNYGNLPITLTSQWYSLSLSEKIRYITDESLSQKITNQFYVYNNGKSLINQHIKMQFLRALQLHSLSHILILRFEEIVGPKGGGNLQQQRDTFLKINDLVSFNVPEQITFEIIDSLWGIEKEKIVNETFFKGYIGRWKEEFNAETIACVKQYYGDILIQLGYEKDYDW